MGVQRITNHSVNPLRICSVALPPFVMLAMVRISLTAVHAGGRPKAFQRSIRSASSIGSPSGAVYCQTTSSSAAAMFSLVTPGSEGSLHTRVALRSASSASTGRGLLHHQRSMNLIGGRQAIMSGPMPTVTPPSSRYKPRYISIVWNGSTAFPSRETAMSPPLPPNGWTSSNTLWAASSSGIER